MNKRGPKPRTFESFLAHRENGCIEWTGVTVKSNGHDTHRYGRFTRNGKKHLAHRVAYERKFGSISPDIKVLHRCDNPLCCNPDHLFLGTQLDNVRDAIAKKRFKLGLVRPPIRKGDENPHTKLSDAQVAEIRALRAAGHTTVSLGIHFNVNSATISRIARGIWR